MRNEEIKEIEMPEETPKNEIEEDTFDAMLEDLRSEGVVIPGGAEEVEAEEDEDASAGNGETPPALGAENPVV